MGLVKTSANNIVLLLAAAAIGSAGCAKGGAAAGGTGGGGGGGGGGTVPNIVGKVSTSSTSSLERKPVSRSFVQTLMEKVGIFTTDFSNCTAAAYDLNGSTSLGSGTVAADGTFTISSGSLTAGSNYKVVTSCADGKKLSAVLGADTTAPATKTPSSVDPLTTLITTQVVSAIISAVNTATSGLPDAAKNAIKAALLRPEVLNNIITTVSSAVKSAVEYGSMEAPSLDAAATMSNAIATATDSNTAALTTAENAYKNDGGTDARQIPPVITDTVAGAAKTAAALPACDSSLAAQVDGSGNPLASLPLCTQAVAKLVYNDVHFGIAIKKSGGAFGTVACDGTEASLNTAFPNAKFTDGTGSGGGGNGIPIGMCVIESKVPTLDRNRSYDSHDDGKHGGMLFFESFATNHGVISDLAASLYNNYTYHLSDLDRMVFGYDATQGGMNARLLYLSSDYDWSNNGQSNKTFSILQTSGGVNSLRTDFTWPTCSYNGGGSGPCWPSVDSFGGTLNPDWSGASQNASLATAIRDSAFTGSVFLKKFGGPIPQAEQVIASFTNETTHSNYNRTGQSKFFVLYAKQPDWQNPNCQWNTTTPTNYTIPGTSTVTTKCTANDGSEEPAVRVNATFSAPDSTTKVTQIASITTSSTGRFYLYPQFNGKFSGLFSLIDSQTGRVIVDEKFNQRAVVVILDAAQCGDGTTHVPTTGCDVGKMYNAKVTWTCSNNSPCSSSFVVGSTTAEQTAINTVVPTGQTAYSMDVVYQPNMLWSQNGPGVVGAGRSDGQNYTQSGPALKPIFFAVNATTGAVSAPELGSQVGSVGTFPTGKYAVQSRQNCVQSGQTWTCTPAGYWMVDSAGVPFKASGTLAAGMPSQPTPYDPGTGQQPAQADWNKDYCPQGGGTCFTPTLYSDSYFQAHSGTLSYADTGTGTWQQVAEQAMIFSGPAANPNYDCSMDPFFVDGSGTGTMDGKINFTTNGTTGQAVCLETTFNNTWEVSQYKSAHPTATIWPNRSNSFVYGDPSSAAALIQKAFGPMLDGQHTLDASTSLKGLQAFGLVYMLMSGKSEDGTHIEGLLPDADGQKRSSFEIMTPVCDGDGGVINCNGAIGKGLLNFRQ